MIESISKLNITNTLYHGTVHEFDKIDLSCGKSYKDFGKGFYLSINRQHSVKLAKSRAKFMQSNYNKVFKCYLYTYALNLQYLSDLRVKLFSSDAEWVQFVLNCRNSRNTPHSYDVVIGHTADSATRSSISDYYDGTYGAIGSQLALQVLFAKLEVHNLSVQYCFCTQRSISALKRIKMEVL